jgi:hypothetical protein
MAPSAWLNGVSQVGRGPKGILIVIVQRTDAKEKAGNARSPSGL